MFLLRLPARNEKKRTSGAKALIHSILYGTAKPVPFVQSSFFLARKAAALIHSILKGMAKPVPFVLSICLQRLKPRSIQIFSTA
jgi:hypothetical protein